MGLGVGIDLGSTSVKLAAVGGHEDRDLLASAAGGEFFLLTEHPPGLSILLSRYRRLQGNPVQATRHLLETLIGRLPRGSILRAGGTASGGQLLAEGFGLAIESEFKAIAKGVSVLHPQVRTVFEMGGETSKFILLDGKGGILDYETNGDCAAGTGSFMDQQASRLRYDIEGVGAAALSAQSAARIAGRCSVFAKTDMVHAQQKGASPPEILRGLCDAVVRNFKGSIVKGRTIIPPVAFIGGLAANGAVAQAVRDLFRLEEGLMVPEAYAWLGAIGVALLALEDPAPSLPRDLGGPSIMSVGQSFPRQPPLSLSGVVLLRDRVQIPQYSPGASGPVAGFLGIDVGSVSTNFALLDPDGQLITEIYVRTDGRPIQVVTDGLRKIQEEFGSRVQVRGVGTTGSGRELIGELVGADAVKDEITAHKTGAMHVSRGLTGEAVDTIFEIGGQDSKFIRIEGGVVVDFTMNEACAAGTGSFLEEQAERLGISIVGEFSRLALASPSPIRLGERCTVFMEQEVNAYLKRGAQVRDLVAGLAYSIALNYLNRVVRSRKIGQVIYFQGGTAYNDAVAAAFAGLLGKRIIVPPHNGVIGAIGAALLAQDWIERTGRATRFRGLDLSGVSYTVREFVCKACPNHCDMQEFSVEGIKTHWGDKCSWKFRKRAKTDQRPVIEDLVAFRERLLWGDAEPSGEGPTIGIPRTMSFYDYFPFWRALLEELGCRPILSDPTSREIRQSGIDLAVAEPCFPVKVAHGHVMNLLNKGVDRILLPNILDAEAPPSTRASHHCPWNQTLPFVLKAVGPIEAQQERLLIPTVHFRAGKARVSDELRGMLRQLGASRRQGEQAVERAYAVQRAFARALAEAGWKALGTIEERGEMGIVLLGRGYNIYDRSVNLDIPGKLRDTYGINVVPLDFLPLDGEEVTEINDNMYWNSGRRILAATRIVGRTPRLHTIYLTNFKCGPDSYIKHFVGVGAGKPILVLQFDDHSNDAGVLTRCEAFLESTGILQWWK